MRFELLSKKHDRTVFDCGNDAINRYFWQMANQHAKRGISRTHLLIGDGGILGFYTLSNTSIDNLDKSMKNYPERIPAILIGRLGIDKTAQGKGLSKILLSHAINKVKALSLDTGIAFIILNAKNEDLAHYYLSFGFEQLNQNDNLMLFLAIKDI